MKVVQIMLMGFLGYGVADASVANLLADRALTKLSTWINAKGSVWLTLPSCYKEGQLENKNYKFTLAFIGPEMRNMGVVSRSGEAQLDEGDPDPSYVTSQTLRFTATFKNITISYDRMSYEARPDGCVNLTSKATADGVSADVVLNLKGHGDSCMAFVDSVNVNLNGIPWITVEGSKPDPKMAPVVEAVEYHFKKNVPKAVATLLKTATFSSLQYYDVCTGVYYPQSPPNVLGDTILNVTAQLLLKNISDWATLPAFDKVNVVNDTNLDVIKVGAGNFSSFGHIRRVGAASYENLANSKLMNLNVSFEITNLTAVYGKIEYIDYTTWHLLAEAVSVHKFSTTLTVTFTRKTADSVPTCVGAGVTVQSEAPEGRLKFRCLTPGIADYVLRATNEVLGPGFLDTVEEAVSDLFQNATRHALAKVCS